ncbi:MAG: type II toxin-antitoxin system RelE/ParE family toxin [Planctomycetota bacterium]
MIESVLFTSDADDDIAEAFKWYEQRGTGLGEDFLRRIDACVSGIKRYPTANRVVFDTFRRAHVRRFPFEIYYEINAEKVIIHYVFHTAQHPQKWRDRLTHPRKN